MVLTSVKFTIYCLAMAVLSCVVPSVLFARDIPPIVSVDWLMKNLDNPKVRVVDIRKAEEYEESHIPKAFSVPYGTWALKKGELDNEIPTEHDLIGTIRSAGIATGSWVIVAGNTDSTTDQVNQTRVAWTLKYAGIGNVAVLDGGFNKWIDESRPLSSEQVRPAAEAFTPVWARRSIVQKDHVLSRIGKTVILDARLPDYYFGVAKLPSITRFGHITHARDLPSAWIFTKEGTFKSAEELAAMASGVAGHDKSREIIVYCDTGRLASGWWWVLSEILGFTDVRLYDGSSQEWSKDAHVPMVKFTWE
jgi:thiosulfate/3-mercaptopyruvate sulfurtransferase